MNNQDYIKGLLHHDKKTLNAIYVNYASRIERHIISKGGSSDDAKDVFQDALMVIYKKAQSTDFQLTSQFYTYLFGTCRFIWDRKRKKKSNNTVTIDNAERYTTDSDIEENIIKREQFNIYKQNFERLGDFCKQILQLFYTKTSMTEIAEKLGLKNDHTARNRKYRCQKELEKLIKADKRYLELQN